ncbi:unnamed protein product [Rhizophagus irregularis]|nr:unnamed protein product [Rhizophagus irregularis]
MEQLVVNLVLNASGALRISKATDLPLSLEEGFVETGREWACIEESKDVLVGGGRVITGTLLIGRPEGTVKMRLEAGAEGEVISTFIESSETIHERLLGAPAVLDGNKGQSPDGAEVSGRGGGGISGLITERARGIVIV